MEASPIWDDTLLSWGPELRIKLLPFNPNWYSTFNARRRIKFRTYLNGAERGGINDERG
jgi:hypothetical protein